MYNNIYNEDENRLELSGVELSRIVIELNQLLSDYYVNNIGKINSTTWLLKFHHPVKQERRIIISLNRGIWETKYDFKLQSPDGLVKILRSHILRAKFSGLEQPSVERIVKLKFGSDGFEKYLITEFFGRGNIILADENEAIIALSMKVSVRHRELASGLTYALPPPRGENPFTITSSFKKKIEESSLEISKCLGRELSLSRKYVEELVFRSGLDSSKKGNELSNDELNRLISQIIELKNLILTYNSKPIIFLRDAKPINASPFPLLSYPLNDQKIVPSFLEALDEVQGKNISEEDQNIQSAGFQDKIAELMNAKQRQIKSCDDLKKLSSIIRDFAKNLRNASYLQYVNENGLESVLKEQGADSVSQRKSMLLINVKSYQIEVPKESSLMGISSLLFDEVKKIQLKISAIIDAEQKLNEKIKVIEDDSRSSITPGPQFIQNKKWFERYRWFYTSGGLLAIGGRDASSNKAILQKHTEQSDLVFHADIHGSPFFILKNGSTINTLDITECAEAVSAFSSAWKSGLSSTDSYWVKPNQVKFSGPSGMYLAKGSFLIEGRKEWVKGLKVQISIGVIKLDEELKLMGGPQTAVESQSLVYVTLNTELKKISDTAKKVKIELTRLLGNELGRELQRLPLDDFIRVLPSGGGRIITSSIGQQKFKDIQD